MEIFLLEDVNGIGKKDDLLIVGDGFALNCLLPQRKALVATPTVRKRYADQIRRRAEAKQAEADLKSGAASALEGKAVEFERKITKAGKLYAAITEKHIVEALKKQHEVEVSQDVVKVSEPIKTLGEHEAVIAMGDVAQPLKVVVKEEK